MNRGLLAVLLLIFITACANTSVDPKTVKKELVHKEQKYSYSDKSGQFLFRQASGFNKKDHSFFTKQSLEMINKSQENALEQSIAFSTLGAVKKKRMILRPKNSEYNVWFEGKKYTSRLKVIPHKKLIEQTLESPEPKWNGVKQYKFPNTKMATCFFSQVVECAKVMGLLNQPKKQSFYVLWEGYPYLNETFTDFPMELFSLAEFEYEGQAKKGEKRFNLQVAGQSIAYLLDKDNKLIKMFWISQGISMINKAVKEDLPDEDGATINSNE